mmetsp:Transcript_29667/g.63560  ORF Transcript_29667/g.63560 Transcript_29667/m.63560 type:complete len:86 (+) Transcript_29667:562-819(+)
MESKSTKVGPPLRLVLCWQSGQEIILNQNAEMSSTPLESILHKDCLRQYTWIHGSQKPNRELKHGRQAKAEQEKQNKKKTYSCYR